MRIRTRFAPSPTGDLHLGSARTALFCWLYAKNMGGDFILRIEDTDRERSTDESVRVIFDGLTWLGLDWNEGPFYQSERIERYQEIIKQLLESGDAYYCNCSKLRLEKLRNEQQQQKIKPRYDGHCRDKKLDYVEGETVVRFKTPQTGSVIFDDIIRGHIEIPNKELDDLIICRTDGNPTYNLTVVVDDMDMRMTHVLRGDDHINNTPRQIHIFNALQATPPLYGHMPMILGEDGKRLSKRHGAVSVLQYRDEGYLPEAMLNYLVRLGWSYGDREIFSTEEMVKWFSLEALNKSPAGFSLSKLSWLNQHYLKELPAEKLAIELEWHLQQLGLDVEHGPNPVAVVLAQRERAQTLKEMAQKSIYFYADVNGYDPKAEKFLNPELLPALEKILQQFKDLSTWEKEDIHAIVAAVSQEFDFKLGKIAQPLRIAATGSTMSPSIDITLQLLGKGKTVARLDKLITYIKAK